MVIKILLGLFFLIGGLYHSVKAKALSAIFSRSLGYLPKPLQLLFPQEFYRSDAFIVSLRISGVIAFLIGVAILVSISWSYGK